MRKLFLKKLKSSSAPASASESAPAPASAADNGVAPYSEQNGIANNCSQNDHSNTNTNKTNHDKNNKNDSNSGRSSNNALRRFKFSPLKVKTLPAIQSQPDTQHQNHIQNQNQDNGNVNVYSAKRASTTSNVVSTNDNTISKPVSQPKPLPKIGPIDIKPAQQQQQRQRQLSLSKRSATIGSSAPVGSLNSYNGTITSASSSCGTTSQIPTTAIMPTTFTNNGGANGNSNVNATPINYSMFKVGMSVNELFEDLDEFKDNKQHNQQRQQQQLQERPEIADLDQKDDGPDNDARTNDAKDVKNDKSPQTSQASPNEHENPPKFVNSSSVIYNGFGGWIAKKKLKHHVNQVAIVKTFKRTEELKYDNAKYDLICQNEYQNITALRTRFVVPVYTLCKDYETDKDDDHGTDSYDSIDHGSSHITYYWSLALPYYKYGDMFSFLVLCDKKNKLTRFTQVLKDNFFKQMVNAVDFLHKKRIVHCDVKLDNFLIDDNFSLKLTDFGMSVDVNKLESHAVGESDDINDEHDNDYAAAEVMRQIHITKIGTRSYRPPELFLNEKKETMLDQFQKNHHLLEPDQNTLCIKFYKQFFSHLDKVDVWALAVCYLYMSLNLLKPWDYADKSKDQHFANYATLYTQSEFLQKLLLNNDNEVNCKVNNLISNNPSCLEFVKRLEFEPRTVILKMLNVDPQGRISVSELQKSQWLNNINFCSAEEFSQLFGKVFGLGANNDSTVGKSATLAAAG